MSESRFCQFCGAAADAGATVCSQCGQPAIICCPVCDRVNPGSARFCASCGTNLAPALPASTGGTASLVGERKYITIMFIDMIDSVSATRDMDPEEADELFQRAHALMREAINFCSGRVARRLGDGILALFGAPTALEDHALEACHAALRILDMGAQARATSPAFRFRIGIHSGLVVLSRSATDFSVEYEPAGTAVAIAARLQNLAAPDTAVITSATRTLLRARIKTRSLGYRDLKGLADPLEIFEITPEPPDRLPFPLVDEPFVGRVAELARLDAAMAAVGRGSGCAIILLGEAGIGKTRLLQEFVRARHETTRVLRASAERYTAGVPYHSVRSILEALFEMNGQPPDLRRARIAVRLRALGLAREGIEMPINDLFELAPGSRDWRLLTPQERDRITRAAIHSVLAAESRIQPLAIILDDAHWADSATLRLFGSLLREIRRLRILLLISARPGFDPWLGHVPPGDDVHLLALDRLDRSHTDALNELLVGVAVNAKLRDLLFAWSLGNPLFVHETVRALVDAGYLTGPPGARDLVREPQGLQPPASITAIIGARIDRLPPPLRDRLHSASILGERFTLGILAAVLAEPPKLLRPQLEQLVAEEFIHLERTEPEPEYAFHHALFQEVCYTSLLRPRRRELHAAAFAALSSTPNTSNQQLAYHAFRGECWEAALTFSREAGYRAVYHSANREAARHFETAIASLTEIDRDTVRLAEAIDLRLELRSAYIPLLQLDAVGRILSDVERLSTSLSDKARQSRIVGFMAGHAYLTRSARQAEGLAIRALQLARETDDRSLEVAPQLCLGMAWHALGQLHQSLRALGAGLEALSGIESQVRLGLPGRPAIMLFCWVALTSAELGAFDAAEQAVTQATDRLRANAQPFEQVYVHASLGFALMKRGDFELASHETAEALRISDERDLPFMVPVAATQLGWLLAKLGRYDDGLALAKRGVHAAEQIGIMAGRARWEARLAEAFLLAGQPPEACTHAQHSLDIAEAAGEELYACYSMALRARAMFALSGELEPAQADLTRAIHRAKHLSLGPFVATCRYELAMLQRRAGDNVGSRANLADALDGFHHYGMAKWVERAAHNTG